MKKLTPIIKKLAFKAVPCCILAAIFLLANAHFSVAYEKEINNLSISMAEKIATSGKKTIAVVDFTDLQGNVTELGRFLAEEFSAALVDTGKGFEVVDRIHLKSILKEHKLSATGLIDPTTARKLGKIAGVDAIVTGTITPFGERVRVSVKVLATDTAKIICASRGNIPKTKAIEELLAKGIETGIEAAAPGTTPAKPKEKRYAAIQKVEANNFTFELQECKMSGTNITCKLLITNNDQDRELTVNPHRFIGGHWRNLSRIFDDSGNIYEATQVQIGNQRGRKAKLMLISDVPTRLILNFEEVSPQARRISLLEPGCEYKHKELKAELRNIPLSK